MNNICLNCVYASTCGTPNRSVPCDGRQTKSERKTLAKNLLADLKGTFPNRNYAYVSEMREKGFTDNAINILIEERLLETCNREKGDVAYAW